LEKERKVVTPDFGVCVCERSFPRETQNSLEKKPKKERDTEREKGDGREKKMEEWVIDDGTER
jgi:hypothetical protein